MKKLYYILTVPVFSLLLFSCSKKTTPSQGTSSSKTVSASVSDPAKPGTTAKRVKTKVPKVIVVNDSVAKKSIDGRYYYDLEGHRYWRSNKDGKYYLYNKSMNTDPAFKAP